MAAAVQRQKNLSVDFKAFAEKQDDEGEVLK